VAREAGTSRNVSYLSLNRVIPFGERHLCRTNRSAATVERPADAPGSTIFCFVLPGRDIGEGQGSYASFSVTRGNYTAATERSLNPFTIDAQNEFSQREY
jgi:hypothetical protein